jgi:hypothetical protein
LRWLLSVLIVVAWATPVPAAEKPFLVVANKHDNTLCYVDPESYKILETISTGPNPHEIVITPDGRHAYLSNHAPPGNTISLVDLPGRKHVKQISIAEAVRVPTSRLARERMAHAALLSGMCLANSGLGMANGVAALGVHCRAPHGAACAVMLPTSLRVNQYACRKDLGSLAHLPYRQGRDTTSPRRAIGITIERIEQLCDEVGVPRRLSELGATREQIPAIVEGSRGGGMSGSPVELSDQDLADHLEAIL